MAEYSKKTVAELQEILKSRGLASSGKKADLIARLTESDQAAEIEDVAEPAATNEVAPEASEEAETAQATADVEPTTADEGIAAPADESAESKVASIEETKNFALNLAASDVDQEMERRKARAARFNTGGQANADAEQTETASADTDASKALERAKRFGTGQTAIGKLDQALSMERERLPKGKKGDAGTENAALDDPGLKKNFSRSGRFAKRRRGGPGRPTAVSKPAAAAYSSERDRQAAEARRKRFAQS